MIKKIYGIITLLVVWFILYALLQTPAIPNPLPTLQYTLTHLSMFLPHLLWSLYRIISAILFAGAIGVLLGVLIAQNKLIHSALTPLIHILYPIPKIAFLPVLMLLFGLGETPKIVLIFSVIVFQFVLGVMDAIQEIEPGYFESVRSLGLDEWGVFKHCIFPAILPTIFTSLRITFGVSVSILFFAETFSTKFGIGYFIMNSYAMVNYQSMYAGIIILSLFGLLVYALIDIIEKKVCPWLY